MTFFWIVGSLALIFLSLVFLFPTLVFRWIFKRPKRSKKVPKFYIGSPHYVASRKGMALMDQIGHQDIFMKSSDGLTLHAYFYPAATPSSKFVLGIHGYRSYARPEFGPYIAFYRSLGYNVLLPDDRAHAPSQGKYIGFGVLDRLDCLQWAQQMVSSYGNDIKILIHGVSMGAATVLAASGETLPLQVKGIIADCGYTSAWDILNFQLRKIPGKKALLKRVERICQKKAGYDFHHFTPLEQVQKATLPILFVHGGKDEMVPSSMVYALYHACSSRKCLLYVKEAAHAESICLAKKEYEQLITNFFSMV